MNCIILGHGNPCQAAHHARANQRRTLDEMLVIRFTRMPLKMLSNFGSTWKVPRNSSNFQAAHEFFAFSHIAMMQLGSVDTIKAALAKAIV